MSTTSTIAFEVNNQVKQITCHWDGGLNYVGLILVEHYSDINKIEKLIDLGNLSSLGPNIEPTGDHSFDEPERSVCVFYGRDRGESSTRCNVYEDINEYMIDIKDIRHGNFNYLFTDQ
jgi:hypothetical protein